MAKKTIKTAATTKTVKTIPGYIRLTTQNREFMNTLAKKGNYRYPSEWLNAHLNQLQKMGVKKAAAFASEA